ncbi:MAG: hybrid sensor histidine kinase/response regulator [Phormidesmis sp.]
MAILAVDDVPDNLFIIDSILGDIDGYHLDCVNDGQSALDYVTAHPPDLILLDVMMPGLDGYEVTRRIRADKSLPYIPILLVTAHDQASLSIGLDSGADDFIRKPFDIDEMMARVRSLIRLKQSLDEQTAMIRQRDDFVARLTHDLRTPLVAANRMLHLSLQGVFGEPPEDMQEAISSVITNNENLLQMTNTLLQVYRHEAGQKKLVRSPLSIYALVKEVVQELKPLADEKGIDLKIEARSPAKDEEDQYRTEGDRIELRRLLTNLLGNAIKFTDDGYILVAISINSVPSSDILAAETIEIAIKDTGAGIDPEAQEQIFDWFFQGDHMRAGSGLGLHLSKRIAEMHKGTLTLESEVGKGSTFTLSLPKL